MYGHMHVQQNASNYVLIIAEYAEIRFYVEMCICAYVCLSDGVHVH